MLMQMRTPVAKALTFVLFGLLILSFAVWGIGDIFRAGGSGNAVVEVEGREIGAAEFDRNLRQEINRLQASFGGQLDYQTARALGVVDQTLQQLVNRALFDAKADDLRMVVTEEQVKDVIAGERAFQNQFGDFDRQRFDNVLRSMGLSEAGYVASISGDLNRQRIVEAVTSLDAAPRAMTEQLFFYGEERRTAEAIEIDREGFSDLPTPTDGDLAGIHEEQSARYMTPETRSVTLLQLRTADIAENIAISEADIEAAFEDRREEFGVPERRDVEQIVLPTEEEAMAALERSRAGTDFATVAQEATGGAPIELGSLTRSELELQLPELADAVFAAEADAVAEPVQSGFGWHLVHVKSVTEGQEPDLAEARETIRDELALEQAVDLVIGEANRLDDILAGGATLEEAGQQLGVTVQSLAAVDDQGRDADGVMIAGLPSLDDFLPVLRGTAVGELSVLHETVDGDQFVLRVDGITPSELRPLEEVRAQVVEAWETQERDKLAQARAEELVARAKEGVALGKIAEDEGLDLFVRGPVDRFGQSQGAAQTMTLTRDMATALFSMEIGEVRAVAGDDGWVVAKLIDIDRPNPSAEAEALATVNERVAQSINGDILASFTAAMRQGADVTVNTVLLEDLMTRY